jgi:TRAP-type mannitol/chloroaromatic compound transport system substrate-binding protein
MKRISWVIGSIFLIVSFFIVVDSAQAQEKVFKWRLASVWPKGLTTIIAPDFRFCELTKKMSKGELDITLYGAGEICKPTEVLDMVSSGTVECGVDWPNYWSGKNTAFDLLGSNSITFCAEDYLLWDYQGGGIELAQELYGKYNCLWFPHYMAHMESGIRSNKPIKKLADIKGMKIRMAGLLPAQILKDLGGTPVSIAVADLYEALRRGTLDGAEYSNPINDKDLKMEEMTKYWLTPGWHQTSSQHGVLINKKAWDSLPEHLKQIIKSAAMDCHLWQFTNLAYKDAGATEYFKQKGITITRLSDKELEVIESIKNKLQEEHAAKNPDYAKILKSQMTFLKMMAPYREASSPFGFGRNPKAYPKY